MIAGDIVEPMKPKTTSTFSTKSATAAQGAMMAMLSARKRFSALVQGRANSVTDEFDLIGFEVGDCKRGANTCGCATLLWLSFSLLARHSAGCRCWRVHAACDCQSK